MNALTAKNTLSLLAIIFVTMVLMTACEQEELLTQDNIIPNAQKLSVLEDDKSSKTGTIGQDEQTYIVTFKSDEQKISSIVEQLRGKTDRNDVRAITEKAASDFRTEVNGLTKQLGVSVKKVKDYYPIVNGVKMTLTTDEMKVLKLSLIHI